MKIKVKFLGGVKPKGEYEIWGGSKATFNAFFKCFENDPEIEIEYKTRIDCKNISIVEEFIENCDLVHVDDTSILSMIYDNGLKPPDLIGPITRSPIKEYRDNWKSSYTKDWFYKAKVIRLNYSEERAEPELVSLIRHGIDTDYLIPNYNKNRKYILWAGMIDRDAKNYKMMEDIMSITNLPDGYEWKILNKYNVIDYWNILDETCILVNTSKYESFCNALFEARSKGVATIQRKLLNGPESHTKAPIQVDYNPESYRESILSLLNNNNYIEVGKKCREYCIDEAGLNKMKDDILKIYKDLYKKKYNI
jgi:glycosyltransferase involved in cell wall biosynthesis